MIRALVFDFDGLVIDSETAVAESWRELYARYGVAFPESVWRSMVGTREHDDALWVYLQASVGTALDVATLDPARKERSLALARELPCLPGVRELAGEAQAAGVALGVASSSSAWWVNDHLERLGLLANFDIVCTKEDAPRSKPDPAIYVETLSRLGIAPREAVACEDTAHGVAAARAAGMRVVAVPGSYTEHMDFSAADMVVGSLAEVTLARLQTDLGRGSGR